MKPTKQQLDKINRMAQRELSEDEVYMFRSLMIDDMLIPDRFIKIHENLLRTCVVDANKNVPLLLNHDSYTMPVGKVIEANLQEDVDDEGNFTKTVYGNSYLVNGKNTQHGVTTTDITASIDDGTLTDVSVGLSFGKIECSICHNDLRDWRMCDHIPGKQYINVDEEVETCIGIAGPDGKGGLRELSLVYSGACPRAAVVNEKKDNNLSINNDSTILSVMDLKNAGVESEILCNFSKNKTELYIIGGVKVNEELNVTEDIKEVTEDVVTEDMSVSTEVSETEVNLESEVVEENLEVNTEAGEEVVEVLTEELSNEVIETTEDVKTESTELTYTNSEIENLKRQLEESNKVINSIKSDLLDKTSKSAIRLFGNSLPKGLMDKFLDSLSVDELRETLTSLDGAVAEKFSSYEGKTKVSAEENLLLPKFEDSLSENNFYAEKALEYMAQNKDISFIDAVKIVKSKYK